MEKDFYDLNPETVVQEGVSVLLSVRPSFRLSVMSQ